MNQQLTIIDIIKKRKSIRTYENKPLSINDRNALLSKIKELDNPFGVSVNIQLIDKQLVSSKEKLGTYGLIKGAQSFLGVSVIDTTYAALAVGYQFENLILYATSLNLGTVWLALTFNRNNFNHTLNIKKPEMLVAVSPVGYPAIKHSLSDNIIRSVMQSSNRKEWNTLFFTHAFNSPLLTSDAGEYATALEMLRLAPSAKNQQPWRVIKENDTFHFYVDYPSHISKNEQFIKEVDLGIGLSHFISVLNFQGIIGHFEDLAQNCITTPENIHYIISWKRKL